MERYITMKIWRETLKKLRLLAAHRGRSIVSIIDDMVSSALAEEESGRDAAAETKTKRRNHD